MGRLGLEMVDVGENRLLENAEDVAKGCSVADGME